MKKTIRGKVCNTETAQLVYEDGFADYHDFNASYLGLYRRRDGTYFMHLIGWVVQVAVGVTGYGQHITLLDDDPDETVFWQNISEDSGLSISELKNLPALKPEERMEIRERPM